MVELSAAEPQLNGSATAPAEPMSLWYRQPAVKWEEALAVGNGRIGAMIFGGINRERLPLNTGRYGERTAEIQLKPGATLLLNSELHY